MAERNWDAVVVGSGIGGLACAAALARFGRRVLVLESHRVAGGLTHTFERNGFRWDVGVHYLGNFDPRSGPGKALGWLTGGALKLAPIAGPYDSLHFPGGFELSCTPPEAAMKAALKQRFPQSAAEIDAWYAALRAGERAAQTAFALRAMPSAFAGAYRWWNRRDIGRWCARTTAQVLHETVQDERLRAVLGAQWGDYGGRPEEASFAVHATVMSHFADGASYPAGGARKFAESLIPVIESAGGEVRTATLVERLLVERGEVTGVVIHDGGIVHSRRVISDAGAHETVVTLLSAELRQSDWAQAILQLRPNHAHVCLYLGLEGDIRGAGATACNRWFYETWDPGQGIWNDPGNEGRAPMLFVSFASLKDPLHEPGERRRHTAEAIAWVNWEPFAGWAGTHHGARPQAYENLKAAIEKKLLAQFCGYFPALAPMIAYHELSTPLSTVAFTGHAQGAFYGLEVTPRRVLSGALRARTPVKGLYLCGQDVVSPGVAGALMGGVLAAAAIDPRVFRRI